MELKNVCYKNIFKDLNYTFVNTKIYGIYASSFFKTDLLFEIINGSIKIDKGIIKMSIPEKPKSPKQLFYTE